MIRRDRARQARQSAGAVLSTETTELRATRSGVAPIALPVHARRSSLGPPAFVTLSDRAGQALIGAAVTP